MTTIGTFSWPPFQVQKGTLKRGSSRWTSVWWRTAKRLHQTQISALLKTRSKATPITQLLIFEVSGGGPLHPIAAGNTKTHRREGHGFWGYDGEQSKRPLGAVLAHPSQTWPLFIRKPGAGRAERDIWAEMIKKRVHPQQKSLVPAVPQSSCRLQIAGWSGSSSCRLPCFLSLHLQKATRNISSSLLRQFPCTQEGRTSAFMLSLQDLLMAVRGSRGLGLGLLQLQKFSGEVPLRWVRMRRALSSNNSVLADLGSPPEQPRLQKAAFCHSEMVSSYFPGSDIPSEVWSCRWVKSRETLDMGGRWKEMPWGYLGTCKTLASVTAELKPNKASS